MHHRSSTIPLAFSILVITGMAAAGELTVLDTNPTRATLNSPVSTTISVDFDQPVNPSTVDALSFWAFGRWSGTATGSYSFTNGDQTVTLTPDDPFSAGESVMVILSHDIEAADGTNLREAGYSFLFWIQAQPGSLDFEEIDVFSTRTTPSQSTRSYGGAGSDLNGDGYLDLSIVNEDTADVRVFLNLADGTGLFGDFLEPPTPINDQASPNEPSDFNRDGNVDLCVCNASSDSVSVLLGNGDGTFAPQQEIAVGSTPRGVAVIDVDGDGDIDIVNTNTGTGNLSLLLNDGNGTFGAPTFFEGGGVGEWALGAADMNEDGILDLVVGAINSNEVIVQTGNGDGTFSFAFEQGGVGDVWMLACGDVNGDGHTDVSTANSTDSDGSILFGNGDGTLSAAMDFGSDPFAIATDLGDIDGDGDLDWVLSSFSGDWWLYLNDGSGNFTFDQEFPAPDAASCSIMLDIDNDGDLDLALIDELDDLVILQRQSGTPEPFFVRGDADGDGLLIISDPVVILDHLFNSTPTLCSDALDIDDDGALLINDPVLLLEYLFVMGAPPPAPWPACGADPTGGDGIDCDPSYLGCP